MGGRERERRLISLSRRARLSCWGADDFEVMPGNNKVDILEYNFWMGGDFIW